jgi:hypothetical protein
MPAAVADTLTLPKIAAPRVAAALGEMIAKH